MSRLKALSSFGVGVLFAVGLGLSGMTDPARVRGFLDPTAWDPHLALVMGGAVLVTLSLFPLILRRRRPLLEPRFSVAAIGRIDAALLGGAALFGVGWGLSGVCPGPGLVSLASGRATPLLFVGAMTAGAALYRAIARAVEARRAAPSEAVPADASTTAPPSCG
jgi:hypothetical protein